MTNMKKSPLEIPYQLYQPPYYKRTGSDGWTLSSMDYRRNRYGIEIQKEELCRSCREKIDKRLDDFQREITEAYGVVDREIEVQANDICGPCKNAVRKRRDRSGG